jgi:acetyl esterase/lipase
MSWQMHAAAAYARLVRKPRTYRSARSAEAFLQQRKSCPEPPKQITAQRHHRLTHARHGQFGCYTLSPSGEATPGRGSVVYVHGGGYVSEIHSAHWTLISDIANASNSAVHVPIYGLAPQHNAAEAIELIQAVIASAASTGPVYIVGDSSGGALALASTQVWLAAGNPPPCGLTLISPWLDIALRNPAIEQVAAKDPWLGPEGLRYIGKRWVADLDDTDPRVSPLFGELVALPPVDLYVGTRDIFMPDCRLLRDQLPRDNNSYHEEPGAIHVYPLLPVPEGRRARTIAVAHIANTLRH